MTLLQLQKLIAEAYSMLPSWKGTTTINLEDDQLICPQYGVFLSLCKIPSPSIKDRDRTVLGYEVSTGGVVTNRRADDEFREFELNAEFQTANPFAAAQTFVQLVFRAIMTEWFQCEAEERLARELADDHEPTEAEIIAYMQQTRSGL
jgi:hypothetical protein